MGGGRFGRIPSDRGRMTMPKQIPWYRSDTNLFWQISCKQSEYHIKCFRPSPLVPTADQTKTRPPEHLSKNFRLKRVYLDSTSSNRQIHLWTRKAKEGLPVDPCTACKIKVGRTLVALFSVFTYPCLLPHPPPPTHCNTESRLHIYFYYCQHVMFSQSPKPSPQPPAHPTPTPHLPGHLNPTSSHFPVSIKTCWCWNWSHICTKALASTIKNHHHYQTTNLPNLN